MFDRWMPVAAAVLGLLGGVGGAYIGGSVANNGLEERFDNERTAQIQDLLIDKYSKFVGTAAIVASVNEPTRVQVQQLYAAEAEVDFVASPDVKNAAKELESTALASPRPEEATYRDKLKKFVEAGAAQLEP